MEKLTTNVERGPYVSCLVDYNHLEGSMDCRLRYISSSDKIICNREIFKKCTYQGDYRRLNHWQLSHKRWCYQTWCLTQRSVKSQCDAHSHLQMSKKDPDNKKRLCAIWFPTAICVDFSQNASNSCWRIWDCRLKCSKSSDRNGGHSADFGWIIISILGWSSHLASLVYNCLG